MSQAEKDSNIDTGKHKESPICYWAQCKDDFNSLSIWNKATLILLVLLTLQIVWNWLNTVMFGFPVSQRFLQWLTIGLILLNLKLKLPHKRGAKLPDSRFVVGLILLVTTLGAAWLVSIKTIYWFLTIALWGWYIWGFYGEFSFKKRLPLLLLSCYLLPQMPVELQNKVSLPLQWLSTQVTAILAGIIIPIKAVGNIFYINDQAYEVTVACSGLNNWIAFIFAGLLVFVFQRKRTKDLIHLLWLAPTLALMLNIIRLFITALVAYFQSEEAGMAIHTNLDFILFPAGLFLMFWFFNQKPDAESVSEPVIEQKEVNETGNLQNKPILLTVIFMLLINVWVGMNHGMLQKEKTEVTAELNYPTMIYLNRQNEKESVTEQWQSSDLPITEAEKAILHPAKHIRRVYTYTQETSKPKINADGVSYFWLSVLETSNIGRLHNVVGSMIASGTKPEIVDTLYLDLHRSPDAPVTHLNASLIRTTDRDGNPYLSLLWYQWPTGNAANRWAWYGQILKTRLTEQKNYNWRLVRVTIAAPKPDEALHRLKNIAINIY